MKPTVFSHTRLSTLDKCEHQYAERYLHQRRPRHDTVEAFVGKRVHEVIEAVHIGSLASNLPDMQKAYFESFAREYYTGVVDVRDYGVGYWRDYGSRCVTSYHERAQVEDGWELVGVEYKLGAPLLEQPLASFIGILDRLVRRTGTDEYRVEDFKTGKMPQRRYFEEDHQIPLYSWLVVRNFELDPSVVMRGERIYLAHDGERQTMDVDHDRRAGAIWWAQHTAMEALVLEEEVRERGRVPRAQKTRLCDWCAYKRGERCPVWALSLPAAREIM